MTDPLVALSTVLYLSVLGVTAASIYLSAATYRELVAKGSVRVSEHLKTSIRELLIALGFLGFTVALMALHELNQFGLPSLGTPSSLRGLSVIVLTLSMAFFIAMSFHAKEGNL